MKGATHLSTTSDDNAYTHPHVVSNRHVAFERCEGGSEQYWYREL